VRSQLKQRSQNGKNQPEQVGHQATSLPRSFSTSTLNRFFGTHSRIQFSIGTRGSNQHRGHRSCAAPLFATRLIS
jgi:hypothetical protein